MEWNYGIGLHILCWLILAHLMSSFNGVSFVACSKSKYLEHHHHFHHFVGCMHCCGPNVCVQFQAESFSVCRSAIRLAGTKFCGLFYSLTLFFFLSCVCLCMWLDLLYYFVNHRLFLIFFNLILCALIF